MTTHPTTALMDCIQTQDLSRQEGKKALWRALGAFGPEAKQDFERYRDEYLNQSFSAAEANLNAAKDVVSAIETRQRTMPASKDQVDGFLHAIGLSDDPVMRLVDTPPVPKPTETQFDRLMAKVREYSEGAHCGIGPSVTWVSANLRTRMADIDPEGVPGCEALSMWLWASQNETEYRRLYDSKRIPARGIAEDDRRGFVDDGKAIEDIMGRIRDGVKIADCEVPDSNLKSSNRQPSNREHSDHVPM